MHCEKVLTAAPALAGILLFSGWAVSSACATKGPDVAAGIRQQLDAANLKNVSVSQDRTNGVVTLNGKVADDSQKRQAESIARSLAGSEVVSDQIAVLPPGAESQARSVDADLDDAIDKNLDAALIQSGLQKHVKYDVKNGVVTLTGQVRSQSQRAQTQSMAASIPNVRQVVNELQVTRQRATSSN